MTTKARQITYLILGTVYLVASALSAQGSLSPAVSQGAGALALALAMVMKEFSAKDKEVEDDK